MKQTLKYHMLRRRQNVLYLAIILTGFFLHLLLWDQDFLQRLGRSLSSWSAFTAMTDAIFAWVRFYLIRGIGVWMVMMAVFLLFVVLPMLSRWKYLPIKPSPLLAVTVSVYFFLAMKLLGVY